MTRDYDGTMRLSTKDWATFIAILFGHAFVVFGALLFWANRIVSLEVRMTNVELNISTALPEIKNDIKEILKRLPRE